MASRGIPITDRFWAFVKKTPSCWIWVGGQAGKGYGRFRVGRALKVSSHRFAYEQIVGEIPPNMQLDHLCRNKLCCNPAHLEVVTNRENALRGTSPTAINAKKILCIHGHQLSGENVWRDSSGGRHCKTCRNARVKAWKQKNRRSCAVANR